MAAFMIRASIDDEISKTTPKLLIVLVFVKGAPSRVGCEDPDSEPTPTHPQNICLSWSQIQLDLFSSISL